MCGANTEKERESAAALFASMEEGEMSRSVDAKAVKERGKQKLKLPDAVVLASADVEDCILVTGNTTNFDVDDLRVRFPC